LTTWPPHAASGRQLASSWPPPGCCWLPPGGHLAAYGCLIGCHWPPLVATWPPLGLTGPTAWPLEVGLLLLRNFVIIDRQGLMLPSFRQVARACTTFLVAVLVLACCEHGWPSGTCSRCACHHRTHSLLDHRQHATPFLIAALVLAEPMIAVLAAAVISK